MNVDPVLLQTLPSLGKITELATRQLAIGSVITKIFTDNGYNPPVLVGGMAVSVYTQGMYKTHDLDLLTYSTKLVDLMTQLGYARQGKDYVNEVLASYVEFPTPTDFPSEERLREYVVPETGLPIYIIGLEDLILDRMGSYSATNSSQCYEWAFKLTGAFYSYIDWSYLHRKAHKLGILDQVNRMQRSVKGNLKQLGLLGNKETSAAQDPRTVHPSSTPMRLF